VKSPSPKSGKIVRANRGHTIEHFARGFVRKRQEKDMLRANPFSSR
jgi:S-ribosylhomocysteine lyase LuxS involved in autoinducer biosynthesis